jgi:hypothetical protein
MTKSSIFVRSWLGFPNSFYNGLFNDCFISIEPTKMIHIVLNKPTTEEHSSIVSELQEHRFFADSKVLDDEKIVLSFNLDEDYDDDFDNFIKGKYSQLSDSAKQLIIMSQVSHENIKNLAVILYPEDRHRKKLSEKLGMELPDDAEVYDRPDIEKEIIPYL